MITRESIFAVRSTVRRDLSSSRIHVPRATNAATTIRDRAQRDKRGSPQFPTQRVELRRRGDRQHQRENQVRERAHFYNDHSIILIKAWSVLTSSGPIYLRSLLNIFLRCRVHCQLLKVYTRRAQESVREPTCFCVM